MIRWQVSNWVKESISLHMLLLYVSYQARINKPVVGSESISEVCSKKMLSTRTIWLPGDGEAGGCV
jgi:hypothetical protein